eukprot:CAMPEP_0201550652 /NCGR_PEP_ID=MMETSP0173_2-20130828/6979_1 /ASSEMBLY_ACC=CAM_ASM_000268 /TAXON_ID=218659 /ORGANISM="Vexillifera sp., Strain DIVA3 564/2" /LENGTH=95 /DNA_ID=CAMNT_0047960691 /DNA_START=53 /DNA_END=340 /DNA_ORIENTATION=-
MRSQSTQSRLFLLRSNDSYGINGRNIGSRDWEQKLDQWQKPVRTKQALLEYPKLLRWNPQFVGITLINTALIVGAVCWGDEVTTYVADAIKGHQQ